MHYVVLSEIDPNYLVCRRTFSNFFQNRTWLTVRFSQQNKSVWALAECGWRTAAPGLEPLRLPHALTLPQPGLFLSASAEFLERDEFSQQFFSELAPQNIVSAYFSPDYYTAPGLSSAMDLESCPLELGILESWKDVPMRSKSHSRWILHEICARRFVLHSFTCDEGVRWWKVRVLGWCSRAVRI